MKSERSAILDYEWGSSLEDEEQLVAKLKLAREKITARFPGVACDAYPTYGVYEQFQVKLRGKNSEALGPALDILFTIAGTPSFVPYGSDRQRVELSLGKFNKRLQIRFRGGLVGRQVVDA